jgi:hypothetical protein
MTESFIFSSFQNIYRGLTYKRAIADMRGPGDLDTYMAALPTMTASGRLPTLPLMFYSPPSRGFSVSTSPHYNIQKKSSATNSLEIGSNESYDPSL